MKEGQSSGLRGPPGIAGAMLPLPGLSVAPRALAARECHSDPRTLGSEDVGLAIGLQVCGVYDGSPSPRALSWRAHLPVFAQDCTLSVRCSFAQSRSFINIC